MQLEGTFTGLAILAWRIPTVFSKPLTSSFTRSSFVRSAVAPQSVDPSQFNDCLNPANTEPSKVGVTLHLCLDCWRVMNWAWCFIEITRLSSKEQIEARWHLWSHHRGPGSKALLSLIKHNHLTISSVCRVLPSWCTVGLRPGDRIFSDILWLLGLKVRDIADTVYCSNELVLFQYRNSSQSKGCGSWRW